MSTRVEVEDIETTRSEKLLAVVLGIFVFIAAVWTYQEIDDYTRGVIAVEYRTSSEEHAAIARLQLARDRYEAASGDKRRALEDLDVRREAYRTALDAGRQAPVLERRYARAQAAYVRARAEQRAALRAVVAAKSGAEEADRGATARFEQRTRDQARLAAALRLGVVVALLGISYWLLARLRRRGSRYFPLAAAGVAAAVALALVLAGDYVTDYADPLDLGPLILAVVGIALTLAAFVALQRYLARRLPYRRVRARVCPFCSYPVRGNRYCEGCGRPVVAACASCDADRRVGTLKCGTCGAA